MIKALVFDFDGMVFLADKMFSDRLKEDYAIPAEEVIRFFKNEFGECQKGKLDTKEAVSKYLASWRWKGSVDELLDYWFAYGRLNEEIVELIKKLRGQGILCVIGTNNEKYRMEYLENKFGLSKLFDLVVASCEVGAKKPEQEFYAEILKKTGLKPEEIIIFDDRKEHIEKLGEMGFVPMIYQGMEKLKSDLNAKNIYF